MAGITRQLVFALDPYRGFAGEFSWSDVADGNSDSKAFLCAYQMPADSDNMSIRDEGILLGTQNANAIINSFKREVRKDDVGSSTENVTGTIVTCRIDPTMDQDVDFGGAKVFHSIEFPGIDSVSKGLDFYYSKEEEKAGDSATWLSMYYTDTSRNFAYFPEGVANWVNLKIIDSTEYVERDVIDGFRVHFYELTARANGET